jgi:hypothetical protein
MSLIETFIADLQGISIDDAELRTIHSKFVQGWQSFLVGYQLVELGTRGDSFSIAELGLESVVEGRSLVDAYDTELQLYVESIGWEPPTP